MLLTSPFLHVSFVISVLLAPIWVTGAIQEKALAVIPAMLGFSLAAFTFSLGIGTDHFRLILGAKRAGGSPSLVSGLSTAFVHFIFVQTIALIINIFASGHCVEFLLGITGHSWLELPGMLKMAIVIVRYLIYWLCALTFVYAVLSGVPAVLNVYMAAKVFEVFASKYIKVGKDKDK